MQVFFLYLYLLLMPFCCLGQELNHLYMGYSEDGTWHKLRMEVSFKLTSDTTAKLFFGYRGRTIGIPTHRNIDSILATYQRQENKLVLKLSSFLLKPPTNKDSLQILKDDRVEIIDYFNDFIAKNQTIELQLTNSCCLIDEKNEMVYVSGQALNLIKQKYPKDAVMFAYNNQKVILYDTLQDTSKLFKEIEEGVQKRHITKGKVHRGLYAYRKAGIEGLVLGVVEFYK